MVERVIKRVEVIKELSLFKNYVDKVAAMPSNARNNVQVRKDFETKINSINTYLTNINNFTSNLDLKRILTNLLDLITSIEIHEILEDQNSTEIQKIVESLFQSINYINKTFTDDIM